MEAANKETEKKVSLTPQWDIYFGKPETIPLSTFLMKKWGFAQNVFHKLEQKEISESVALEELKNEFHSTKTLDEFIETLRELPIK